MSKILIVSALFLISSQLGSTLDVTCKNEIDGSAIDWYVLYKLPKDCATDGVGNNYMSASSKSSKLKTSSKLINQTDSFPGKTLSVYYQARKDKSIGYILYNDQPPKDSNTSDLASRAHAKGIVLISDKTVTFVSHSIPRYPPVTAYGIDSSQCKYGQSMICVSLKLDQLPALALHFSYLYPNVYDCYLPSWLSTSNPTEYNILKTVCDGKRVTKDTTKSQKLVTVAKKSFDLFSKSSYFGQDLYAGLVGPHYKTTLMVESWLNGEGGVMDNICSSTMSVVNIEKVRASDSCSFASSKDHSKWTVGTDAQKNPVICIGDINRMDSQNSRGGGTLCMQDADMSSQYINMVSEAGKCST